MTQEEWKIHHQQKSVNILLQVAFKAAVQLVSTGTIPIAEIPQRTLAFHSWLLSQTEGKTPASEAPMSPADVGEHYTGEAPWPTEET